MSMSPEELRRAARNKHTEGINKLRERIQQRMHAAAEHGDTNFGVEVPDGVTTPMEEAVIKEFREQGWSVSTRNAPTSRYIDFSA